MGFPKRLLSDDEILVLELRPHVKVLARPVLTLLVVSPIAALLAGYVPDWSIQLWLRVAIGVIAGVILLRWTLWPFIVWWNTVYAVTTRRLVIREGVFNRSGHDMPLTRLNDVSFSHNFFQRMLGCGTLVVESAGEHGQLELDNIPKVERVQRTLYRLSDDARTSVTGGAQQPYRDVDPELADDDELPDEGEPDDRPRDGGTADDGFPDDGDRGSGSGGRGRSGRRR